MGRSEPESTWTEELSAELRRILSETRSAEQTDLATGEGWLSRVLELYLTELWSEAQAATGQPFPIRGGGVRARRRTLKMAEKVLGNFPTLEDLCRFVPAAQGMSEGLRQAVTSDLEKRKIPTPRKSQAGKTEEMLAKARPFLEASERKGTGDRKHPDEPAS